MNYSEMLFNRDERLIYLLNNADSKNLELIVEINKLEERIDKAIEIINKALCPNSDYVDYEFGDELLRQELLEILKGEDKE